MGTFSRLAVPTAVPALIKSSSSLSRASFLRSQTLHITAAIPRSRIVPPTPTTTPMIVFLALVLRPGLPKSPPLELRLGDEEVVIGGGVEV